MRETNPSNQVVFFTKTKQPIEDVSNIMNNNGDNESPYLRLLDELKWPLGIPLIITENLTV